MNSYKNDPKFSQLTNQIKNIHSSLYRAAIPENCKSSFKSVGIDSELITINNNLVEVGQFHIEECRKVRAYRIEFILELINNHLPLTQNQMHIFYLYQQQNPTDNNFKRLNLLNL